ncbi:histidine kinase [Nonomuraea sp. NPDC049158]|uniref:ATP-binding protein n=1 Tax=Nonomuraea sp. NPDC049158 TaxID=3155649 RepID=UPI00340E4F1D
MGDGRPEWRDVLLPGILAVALMALTVSHRLPAALTWVADPGSPLAADSPLATTYAMLGSGAACVALVFRRIAPVWAFGGTLAAAVPSISAGGGGVLSGVVTVMVALYALSLHRTAGVAAVGACAVTLAGAALTLAAGAGAKIVAGVAFQAAAMAAVVWVMGRSRRRRRAGRSAVSAYHAGSASVPRLAAGAERRRLIAELHDVAAHRLTGIVVSAATATRLTDPELAAAATRHAAEAGRQAVTELDRLAEAGRRAVMELDRLAEAGRRAVTELDRLAEAGGPMAAVEPMTMEDIDVLVAEHIGLDYRRTAISAPPEVIFIAYRVVREALTNATRYAAGASRVRLDILAGHLVVTVTDEGGDAAASDLGTGNGLAGLRSAVHSVGGTFSAGPKDGTLSAGPKDGTFSAGPRDGTFSEGLKDGGWEVRADLPLDPSAPTRRVSHARPRLRRRMKAATDAATDEPGMARARRMADWRGSRALDGALVVLAIALTLGANLLPGDDLDPFATPLPGLLLALLFALHALPLGWRTNASRRGLAVTLVSVLVWLCLDLAGWAGPPVSDMFLWCCWMELALLYAIGARTQSRDWPAPIVMAGVGGLALVSGDGITGDRPAAWLVLTAMLAVPAVAAWGLGRFVAARRRRRRTAVARERDLLERAAAVAAAAERRRIVGGLRRTARRHAQRVVDGAEAGRLDVVLAEARAGLAALRELMEQERDDGDEPPHTVSGIAVLTARRGGAARYVGLRRPLPPAVEVTAYQVARELLAEGAAVAVTFLDGGVTVSGQSPTSGGRLRALVDAADGTLIVADDGSAQVWLPEVSLT